MKSFGAPAAVLLFSVVSWHVLMWPLVWIFLAWAVGAAVATTLIDRRGLKLLALNAFMFSALLCVIEVVLWIVPEHAATPEETVSPAPEGGSAEDYLEDDVAPLGYRPRPNSQADAKLLYDGRVIYDVSYTIDSDGLRVTPSALAEAPPVALLFFGGSFTFGEGLNDSESMPYRLAEMTDRRYHVLNFGFHGYGPHQMLAALESGMVDKILGARIPEFILYQAVNDHARRAAGYVSWDTHGPRYRLEANGSVTLEGPFDQTVPKPSMLRRSSIGRRILDSRRGRATDADRERLAGIVTRSRKIAEKKWPGVKFLVLVWDTDGSRSRRFARELERWGIQFRLVSDVIPNYFEDREMYLIPHDNHPNADAQDRIAGFVATLLP